MGSIERTLNIYKTHLVNFHTVQWAKIGVHPHLVTKKCNSFLLEILKDLRQKKKIINSTLWPSVSESV